MKKTYISIFPIVLLSLLLTSCGSECSYEEQITELDTLSSTQWENIFNIIKEKSSSESNLDHQINKNEINLEALNIIDYRYIEISKKRAYINVGGCFDNKLYLQFNGLKDTQGSKIVMTWGEHPIKEKVLWKGNPTKLVVTKKNGLLIQASYEKKTKKKANNKYFLYGNISIKNRDSHINNYSNQNLFLKVGNFKSRTYVDTVASVAIDFSSVPVEPNENKEIKVYWVFEQPLETKGKMMQLELNQ